MEAEQGSEGAQAAAAAAAAAPSFLVSLVSGGVAGTSVDVALFPLDTIKTRLQSAQGFFRSGGFRGIYSGLSAAAAGSAPGAALFFSTYEMSKQALAKSQAAPLPVTHMLAASVGEVVACLVRVPTEIVKQRMQAGLHRTAMETVRATYAADGLRGFYVGYGTTVMREIPFSLIQFPIWEFLKSSWSRYREAPVEPYQAALCGSLSGAFSAAVTTPLDVAKTRLMLREDARGKAYKGTINTLRRIAAEEGTQALFSGLGPRVMWIAIGGFVFFGAYETTQKVLL